MKRAVFLDSDNSTKVGKVHTFSFNRKERDFKQFVVKSAQVQYNPTVSTAVTRETVQALNPYVFVDWADTTKISPTITQGDSITSVVSTGTASVTLYSSAAGLKYDSIGSAPACLSETNWHYFSDSSHPQSSAGQSDTSQMIFMFQHDATPPTYYWLFKNRVFRVKASTTVITLVADTTDFDTTCVIQAGGQYIVSLIWDDPTMSVKVIDLATNIEQTDELDMPGNLSPTPDYNVYLSNAQTGFLGAKIGSFMEFLTTSATVNETAINFLKQAYSGVAQQTTSTIPTGLVMCSTFLTDRRTGKSLVHNKGVELLSYQGTLNSEAFFAMRHEGRYYAVDNYTLEKIDVFFTKTDGTVVDVSHFSVSLDLLNDMSQL